MAALHFLLKRAAKSNRSDSLAACRAFSSLRSSSSSATAAQNITTPPQIPPFDHQPHPYNGPSADQVFAKRKTFLGPSLFHFYQKPVSFLNKPHHSLIFFFINLISFKNICDIILLFLCILKKLVNDV
jgi:alanine-glyoxylate transaminase/(R)-3-amino-2-methylpropionate-pyruvate transaminase